MITLTEEEVKEIIRLHEEIAAICKRHSIEITDEKNLDPKKNDQSSSE